MEELNFLGSGKYRFLECTPDQQKISGAQKGKKEELDWIRRQLEYSELSEKYKLRYNLERGEIYQVDWGINVNSEFSNIHYGVVVVSSNEFNPLVIMCPLKTMDPSTRRMYDLDLGLMSEFSFSKHTFAIVHQIRCVDKLRLRKVGVSELISKQNMLCENDENDNVYRLSDEKMKQIILAYSNIIIGSDLKF